MMAVQTPKRMNACAPSEPMRKRLVAMDSDGSHGTSGTPHTLGARAAGTRSWMPSVPAAHAGTSTVYPTHRSGAAPQYAAMPADEPMTTDSNATSRLACVLLVTPRTTCVPADEEGGGHHHEDEERADGEEAGEHVEAGEEADAGAGGGDEHGGVHRRAGPGVHQREHRRDDVAARDVRGVPSLTERPDQQHRRHPLERAERHHVLRPPHPDVAERHRVRRAPVDRRVRLHHAQHQRHHAVDGRDHRHGAEKPERDVSRWVLGLLRHGRDVVEPAVGEVDDRRRAEHARHAVRHERGQVAGLRVEEAGHDDEGYHEDVHGGGDPVDAGGALGAQNGQGRRDRDHHHRDGVQLVVPLGERRLYAQRARRLVDERREVRRPGARHRGRADDALEDEVRGGDEGRHVAELDAEVGEGAAGHGDLDGELRVAEHGQHGGEAGGHVGEHDGRAGVVVRLLAGEHEDPGTDDGAEPEPREVPPREAAAHLVLAAAAQRAELVGVGGAAGEAVAEPRGRRGQRRAVRAPAREGRLREEIFLLPPPVAPRLRRRLTLVRLLRRIDGRHIFVWRGSTTA
ncbi:Os01g0209901, partial [Oryza sativa Japonica Group]